MGFAVSWVLYHNSKVINCLQEWRRWCFTGETRAEQWAWWAGEYQEWGSVDTGGIWSARRGDWKCSLNWSTVWVWELTFLVLGLILAHWLQSQESIKSGFGETEAPAGVTSARPGPATLQPFSGSLSPAVISHTKETSRTIGFSEPKVTLAILSALVAVPFRPCRESISAVQDWHSSLFP